MLGPQPGIGAIGSEQLLMAAAFDNAALIQHQNLLGMGTLIEMLDDAQSEFVFMNFKEKEIVLENESINLEGSWDYNKVRRL